ncbi:uncharacterized protein LOC117917899 [Vitis riparia]|uniref:uncharacterized protein LOC117917899 n=1 Tax=Vitis riparia TaxID=96939 RepID=UPI00155B11BC|nr:uncharacterized protein LOC117917899 [Vitis riparia]
MELFRTAKAVTLRSHLDKYLVADDDKETVRQSRNGLSRKAKWLVEGSGHVIRLKSCHGRYLTASDTAYLLGMTGKKVTQTVPGNTSDALIEWEPIRDGFQVKFKTRGGKFLRANGGTPPWRNSVTHDYPNSSATRNWILWDVEPVEVPEVDPVADYLSSLSSFSSISDDLFGSEPASPMSITATEPFGLSSKRIAMELFHNAKAVRLRSHHDKYLLADDDEESVIQDRSGSSKTARWTVELVKDADNIIRLRSCFNKYLTASNQPFLLGMTGRKVLQTRPGRLDSSVEWEPVKEGNRIKLRTRYGNFLRANGGLPPWRNSVTHDVPHRTATQDWILWVVDIVEIQIRSPTAKPPLQSLSHSDSFASASDSSSPSSVSLHPASFSRQESNDSLENSPPKTEGRTIYYHVADDNGNVDDSAGGQYFTLKENGVFELTRRLEEETGLEDIIVCSRSNLNGKLYPLRLQLPPNNATMHVIVIQASSKAARSFAKPGIP